MRLIICSVFDSAVQAFGRPIFVPAIGAAVRSFTDEINRSDPQNGLFAHPDDYVLYELASWDDEFGTFSLIDAPRVVSRGKDVKQQ